MVQVWSESFECKVSAKRLWHGLFKDAHNCLPKALPLKVVGVEYPTGQLGFELPGAERIIRLHKGVSDEIKELLHKEAALAKKEAETVGFTVHKEALLAEEKAEEAAGAAHKEAWVVKGKLVEEAGAACKEAHLKKEEVSGAVYEGAHVIKEAVSGAAHAIASIPKKVIHKGVEHAHKGLDTVEKVVHKEEDKVDDIMGDLKHEELWVKEKIEEVEYEASKATISVLAKGFIALLFKHYKHTFELKDHISDEGVHGCILHWTSEFEAVSTKIHLLHSFDALKKHALETFHGVEDYLLKHDDYAC